MKFEVFGKSSCAKCRSTKDKLGHVIGKSEAGEAATIAFIDMDTVAGLAEAAFNDVQEVPTTILRSDGGDILARWDALIPPSVEIQSFLAGSKV
jgi:hypothetical protein